MSTGFSLSYFLNSPSRARTYNNSVNSRVLYHWAIEDYSVSKGMHPQNHIQYNIFFKTFQPENHLTWSLFFWSFPSTSLTEVRSRSAPSNDQTTKIHAAPPGLAFIKYSGQAFDLLVAVSSMHCCTSTPALSTSSSSRGLTASAGDISSWGGLHA